MKEREKELLLTRDIVPMKFYTNRPGTEPTEQEVVRAEVHIYEKPNHHPVFVAFERNDSPQPYGAEQSLAISDWAQETYGLKPNEVIFYEKKRDVDHYQKVESVSLGAGENNSKTWDVAHRYNNNFRNAEEIDRRIGGGVFSEPDLGQEIDRADELSNENMPSLETVGTVADREIER